MKSVYTFKSANTYLNMASRIISRNSTVNNIFMTSYSTLAAVKHSMHASQSRVACKNTHMWSHLNISDWVCVCCSVAHFCEHEANFKTLNDHSTDLGQRSEHLLLDVPHQAFGRKLQALVHVQLGHMDAHQQPTVPRLWWRILVKGGGRMIHVDGYFPNIGLMTLLGGCVPVGLRWADRWLVMRNQWTDFRSRRVWLTNCVAGMLMWLCSGNEKIQLVNRLHNILKLTTKQCDTEKSSHHLY